MGNNFFLEVADFIIEVKFEPSDHPDIYNTYKKGFRDFCNSYILESTDKRIDFILKFSDKLEGKTNLNYNKSNSQPDSFTAIYKEYSSYKMVLENILYFLLSKNNGLIIHSSAIGTLKNGYLFVGKSGAGKSTIAKLLSSKYTALTDDTTILRKIKNQLYIYQHPFFEKNYYPKSEGSYLLKGVFFLSKKRDFKLKKLTDKEYIFIRLVKQLTVSDISTLQNLMKLVSNFDYFYTLSFSKNQNKMVKFFKSEIL